MTRHVILGNGNILVCLDKNANIRDFYYPYVGQENHVSSHHHRTGVWVDKKFSWINKDSWKILIDYKKDSLVSEIKATNEELGIRLTMNEAVHHEKNIFLRQVKVENLRKEKRKIKVFFSQHFHISEANIGDTVYYNPNLESIINYKGKRYFLIGGTANKKTFDDYATGAAGGVSKKLGTYVDAEDGSLSKNPIEHGSVDSTIGFTLNIKGKENQAIDYWIAVGTKHSEVQNLKNFIIKKTTTKLLKETEQHWIKWVNKKPIDFEHLSDDIQELFKRSLLIVRAQTDNRGAIIAANDTHTFHYKKDTYSYMWPRDGALIARSLDRVGHFDITNRFFNFCTDLASENGYLFHKYRPDGSLGSSWHSWLKGNRVQLPIQEDETALVLDALWKNYCECKNIKTVKNMYQNFIKKSGDFLVDFRDPKTKLPKESYDLWEEKLGVHTFTCATVYAGLQAAKNFSEILEKKKDAQKYKKAAEEVKEATIKYLYDQKRKIFIKGIYYDDKNKIQKDQTIDSSTVYGLFEYKILDIDDPRLETTMNETLGKLWCKEKTGGMCRYENDFYYRIKNAPENPWFISTMWLAEYHIAKAKTIEELKPAEELLQWTTDKALNAGILSEQINPLTGEALSVAPLTWSHAGFIIAVVKYLDKLEKLNINKEKRLKR